MGKISNALDKYSKERKENKAQTQPPIALNQEDLNALLNYDRETKHLIRYDEDSGEVDQESIEVLRNQGTIQRLLDSKLIYPGGRLTARGIRECRRLEAELGHRPILRPTAEEIAAADTVQTTDISLEDALEDQEGKEEVDLPEPEPPEPQEISQASLQTSKRETVEAARMQDDERSVSMAEGPEKAQDLTALQLRKPAISSNLYSENAIDPNLVALLTPHSFEAEQFKILRTNILFPVAGKPPRSILVTSSGPGEGKTFAAANLAISIALNINKYVLLIDGDLRKPELHRRFGFGRLPGLTDYLVGRASLSSLLVKTKVEKLTLLPAGEPPDNPSELVSSEAMASLIKEVTNRYSDRLIVIDSPPPRLAAETGVLARQVDGILLVVSYGKTRREHAEDLIETMGREKVLGSLINYINPRATRYYGYSHYGYYGKK